MRHAIRSVVAVVSAIGTMLGITIATASPASACSGSAHCWGTVVSTASNITGVSAILDPTCISALPSNGMASQQVWLAGSGTNPSFVEVGFLRNQGTFIGQIYDDGLWGFWGDYRPGSSYYTHVIGQNPSLGATTAEVYKNSAANSFVVKFGSFTGYSNSNTMAPAQGQWGAETSVNGAHNFGKGTGVSTRIGSTWQSGAKSPLTYKRNISFTWTSSTVQYTAGSAC